MPNDEAPHLVWGASSFVRQDDEQVEQVPAELGREVSLINSASRVVVTNDSRYVTGDVIAEVGNSAGERGGGRRLVERVESSKYPFSLVRFGD